MADVNVRALRHVFGMDRRSPVYDGFSLYHYDNAYRDLPPPTGPYPFHLDLQSILGKAAVDAIGAAGKMVFHAVGDTGNLKYGAEAQDSVAAHMVQQIENASGADVPLFFYHLGDVIYFNGEEAKYEPQFYEPYLHYTAPIFAVPGNHDGEVLAGNTPLQGFMENFCAAQPQHTWMAGQSNRTTMIQPNAYWTLKTPLATIIGLYSNVPGQLDKSSTTQQDWLSAELSAAKNDPCVIVVVHHPPYSLDTTHGGYLDIQTALDAAMSASGRIPTAVMTGHVYNYQRFERDMSGLGGGTLTYVIAGAGGFAGYTGLHQLKPATSPAPGVQLVAHNADLPGFLRLTVSTTALTGEYFVVPAPPNHLTGAAQLVDSFAIKL